MKHDRLKRIFCMLLCLCMMVSYLPAAAHAAETACTCTTVCTAESINADCPVCGVEDADLEICAQYSHTQELEETTAPTEAVEETESPAETTEPSETTEPTVPEETVDEAVAAVQSMIDALPTPEECAAMDEDAQTAAYDAAQAAYDAYEALTAEQMEKIDLTRLVSLMDWFNGQTEMLDDKPYWTDDGNYDISWYTSDQYLYTLTDAADLAGLAVLVNGLNGQTAVKFASYVTIQLSSDIDLSAHQWKPIGCDSDHAFTGTFSGNRHTISGMSVNETGKTMDGAGLFGCVENSGSVRDLNVSGSVVSDGYHIGGIVGYLQGSNLIGCTYSGSVTGGSIVGGLVGTTWNSNVVQCTNYATVNCTINPDGKAGGIAGDCMGSINNCRNFGAISGTYDIGGIAGKLSASSIKNSYNAGSVTGTDGYVGGIAGYVNPPSSYGTSLENCYFLKGTAQKGLGSAKAELYAKVVEKESTAFSSGEVAYLLNGKPSGGATWKQTLGTDTYPGFSGGSVYYVPQYAKCDKSDTPTYVYTNQNVEYLAPEHQYAYRASETVITEYCRNCSGYEETATITMETGSADLVYNGNEHKPGAAVTYSDGWQGGELAVEYSNNINAGTNTATAYIQKGNTKAEVKFSIAPAAITSVTLEKTSTVYNAENQMPSITAVKAGELTLAESDYTVSYTDSNDQPVTEMKNAGTYKIVVTANNSNFSGSKPVEWKIEKATLTVNRIWQSTAYTYNGRRQYPGVQKSVKYAYTGTNLWTGFAEAASVTWTYSTEQNGTYSKKEPAYTNAGTYTVYYKVSGQNYHEVSGSYNVTIDPAPLTIVGAAVADKTYDGTTTGTVTGVTFNGLVNGEKLTMGADYTATAEIQSANVDQDIPATVTVTLKNTNYSLTQNTYRAEAKVDSANRSAPTGLTAFDETISGKADGKITGLTTDNDYYVGLYMEYRKEGETSYTRVPEGHTELTGLHSGKYYIRYAATRNYNASPDAMVEIKAGRKLTITLPTSQTGYTLTAAPTEVAYNGSATLTFALLNGYTAKADFAITATSGSVQKNADGTYTLSGIKEDTTVSVTGVVDETAPTAEIKVATNGWKTFLNTITFDRFFKETQTVTITADDKGSGVDKISYYLSESALTLEQVKAIETWTEYTDAFSISAEQKYVVYAKVTDKAGNTTYISSDGLVLDMTAPVITGVENGKTYYTTQKVTANDTYLDSLTGTEADGTVPGDVEKVYTLTAKDKAGNSTTFTITMKPISSIREGLPTMDALKISDKAAIEAIKATASNVLASQCANATDAEKAKLEKIIADCDALLEAIQNAEDAVKQIEAMPDAKNTQPDDKAAIDAYEAAKAAYDKLTENEKRMVGEDNKAKLDAMYAALTAYDITKGDGSTWTKGSASGLTFTANGYFGKFTELKVDGETVDAKHYDAQSGSTVITLKASYLQTLKTGKHTIQVVYTDGATDGADTFTIKAAGTTGGNSTTNGVNSPGTGDHSNMALWIALLCVSAAGMATLLLVNRKRRSAK